MKKKKKSLASSFFLFIFFLFYFHLFFFYSFVLFSFFILFYFFVIFKPKHKKDKEKGKIIPNVMCIFNDDATSNGSKCNDVMEEKKMLEEGKGK